MAERVGSLAAQQESLQAAIERDGDSESAEAQQQQQRELREETQAAGEQAADSEQAADAAEKIQAAQAAQQRAEQALSQGNQGEAQRQAAAAASLLREAQRDLAGDQQRQDEQDNNEQSEEQQKVIEVVRALRDRQATVLAQIIVLENKNNNAEQLAFPIQRALQPLAANQASINDDIELQVIPLIEKLPVARWGLRRVISAVQAAQEHYARPALGDEGVARGQRALLAFDDFLATVEELPDPDILIEGEGQQGPVIKVVNSKPSHHCHPQQKLLLWLWPSKSCVC